MITMHYERIPESTLNGRIPVF